MPQIPDFPEIEIMIRRSPRARRFSLRLSGLDGRVTLSMPARAPEAQADAFLQEHADWLRQALARSPGRRVVVPGTRLPVEGQEMLIAAVPGPGIRRLNDSLLIGGDPASLGPRLGAWLRALARDRLVLACDRHAGLIGQRVSALRLRDTRSRWGSCSPEGALMFSWRLILAPPAVLDYVAAHEVAHLKEMNHSAAFWAVVARLCPAWQAQRRWLREAGPGLHAWDFAALARPGGD